MGRGRHPFRENAYLATPGISGSLARVRGIFRKEKNA